MICGATKTGSPERRRRAGRPGLTNQGSQGSRRQAALSISPRIWGVRPGPCPTASTDLPLRRLGGPCSVFDRVFTSGADGA